jgi:hypothetical protein
VDSRSRQPDSGTGRKQQSERICVHSRITDHDSNYNHSDRGVDFVLICDYDDNSCELYWHVYLDDYDRGSNYNYHSSIEHDLGSPNYGGSTLDPNGSNYAVTTLDLNSPDYAGSNLDWCHNCDWLYNHDSYELHWEPDLNEHDRCPHNRHNRSVEHALDSSNNPDSDLYWHWDGDWLHDHDCH